MNLEKKARTRKGTALFVLLIYSLLLVVLWVILELKTLNYQEYIVNQSSSYCRRKLIRYLKYIHVRLKHKI